ncbi:MAG: DUF4347 domain-containing protein, partial [Mariprofundaceae bacterium]
MANAEKQATQREKHTKIGNGKLKTGDSGPMLALEPRILLDAALADTAAKVTDAVIHQGDGTSHAEAKPAGKDMLLALAPMGRDQAARDQIRREVIFIDAGAKNIKELLAKATPEKQVVVLNPNRDGVQQITRVLGRMGKVDAVHIFSHGEGGKIQLGRGELSLDNIGKYQRQLKAWASHLTNAADILVYGCNVAEGQRGADFVRLLAELTQADVAASTDLTGAADQGGDWDLEKTVGDIETDLALSVDERDQYDGTLAYTNKNLASRLYFDGTAAKGLVTAADFAGAIASPASNLTMEAWIKPDSSGLAGFSTIVTRESATSGIAETSGALAMASNGSVYFYTQTQAGTGTISLTNTSSVVATDGSTWTHVAAT